MLVTSSSADRLARARAPGAAVGIDYTVDPTWGRTVVGATGGRGVDRRRAGRRRRTLDQSLAAVRPGGRVALIATSRVWTPSCRWPRRGRGVRLQGVLVGSRDDHVALNRARRRPSRRPPLVDRCSAGTRPRGVRPAPAGAVTWASSWCGSTDDAARPHSGVGMDRQRLGRIVRLRPRSSAGW
ncbi:MAG: hypothetical protein H6733_13985 [Alphaproteobacteria bacterium]|nr:hypothetical protein [Alphaproteobacteria bacterium]